MAFPIDNNISIQGSAQAPNQTKKAQGKNPEQTIKELTIKKGQEQSGIDTLELSVDNNEGQLNITTQQMEQYQQLSEKYGSAAETAQAQASSAEARLQAAEAVAVRYDSQIQNLDAQIEKERGFLNSIKNFFTGLFGESKLDELTAQREAVAANKEAADAKVQAEEETKEKYEQEAKTNETKQQDAEKNYEKQKQISESIQNKINEAKEKIGDKEMKIEDYENAIREAFKEANCSPTDETIAASAASIMAADKAAQKNDNKNTAETDTSNATANSNSNSATTDAINNVAGEIANGEQEDNTSEENQDNAGEQEESVTTPIDSKINGGLADVIDGVAKDGIESDITQKTETSNTEEAIRNDSDMTEEQQEQTIQIATTVAKYEEVGVNIDPDAIKAAIENNNVAELDAAVEAAVIESTMKSTGRVMMSKGIKITTKKESKENSEAASAFLNARADLNKTYSANKGKSQDIQIEDYLNTTNAVQTNIVNGDTYGTSELKSFSAEAESLLAQYDTTRNASTDSLSLDMKFEQEKTKAENILAEEKEQYASDDKVSTKVQDVQMKFITTDYRYRNTASAIEKMSFTKDMTNIYEDAQKIKLEEINPAEKAA